jgi:hypothetical protein
MEDSMFDLVLRGQRKLSRHLAEEDRLPSSILKLVGLSLVGLVVHGLVVGVAARGLGDHSFFTRGTPWIWIPLALVGAFMGALCICLPSFYFYTQLSGLDASFRLVTAQALRAQATTAVLLLGALPFYAAWVLGVVAVGPGLRATSWVFDPSLATAVGMALPFVVGLFGVRQVYLGFKDLILVVPITHPRRGNFLGRMVVAWGGVFCAVSTVALWRLAETLGQLL